MVPPTARLTFLMLGTPQLRRDGAPLPVARRQVRALLYCLANELRPVPRDRLAFLLWPDTPDATARRNLIRLLSYARQVLIDPDLLHSDATAVALNPAQVEVDTVQFARACGSDTVIRWEAASALYRGAFLDGFVMPDSPEFDQWLGQTRRQYERAYLDLLRRLVVAKTGEQEYPAAIDYARAYLALDELAE